MLFDKSDIELLRLVAQCKDFPVGSPFPNLFMLSEANAGRLREEGLLNTSRDGRRYRVTTAGYALLDAAGIEYPPERYRENDPQALIRRERSAQVSLTLLLAGVDIYAKELTQVRECIYLSAGNVRRIQRAAGRNLAGNTRFTGLTTGFVFYYVADPRDSLYYKQETRFALNLLAQSRSDSPAGIRPAVVYMGESYSALIAAVTASAGSKATYRTAYDKFTMPVYLCPCNPDGAFQMRIMLRPDYRKRLIEAMMEPAIPNPFYAGCDGTLNDEPFIIGIDMDFRRISGMVGAARAGGVKSHIFARRCQCKALREALPGADIKFYAISDDDIMRVFGFHSFLAEPTLEPYITKEGDYLHDQTLRACREARKANRKKDKASQKEN